MNQLNFFDNGFLYNSGSSCSIIYWKDVSSIKKTLAIHGRGYILTISDKDGKDIFRQFSDTNIYEELIKDMFNYVKNKGQKKHKTLDEINNNIKELIEIIRYLPGGIEYIKAKEDFETNI